MCVRNFCKKAGVSYLDNGTVPVLAGDTVSSRRNVKLSGHSVKFPSSGRVGDGLISAALSLKQLRNILYLTCRRKQEMRVRIILK
jgi:hypothetical protein